MQLYRAVLSLSRPPQLSLVEPAKAFRQQRLVQLEKLHEGCLRQRGKKELVECQQERPRWIAHEHRDGLVVAPVRVHR